MVLFVFECLAYVSYSVFVGLVWFSLKLINLELQLLYVWHEQPALLHSLATLIVWHHIFIAFALVNKLFHNTKGIIQKLPNANL